MTKRDLFQKTTYLHELEVRIKKVSIADNERKYFSKAISGPEETFQIFKNLFHNSPVELFVVIHLKSNNQISAFETVSKGTLNQSLVHPREVFKSAILRNASSIIIAHNHPSGNLEPSQEDIAITKQLVEAGKIIGIKILDHIIFSTEGYYSFAEHGIV